MENYLIQGLCVIALIVLILAVQKLNKIAILLKLMLDLQRQAFDVDTEEDDAAKLYVGNIDYGATEDELKSLFARFGKVSSVNIPVNKYTGKTRGFGFVAFFSKDDAQKARSLHGTEFKGRQLQVSFAKDRN